GVPALEGNGTHALMFSTMDPVNRPSPGNKGFDVPDAIEAHFLAALAVKPDERCESLKTWWTELTRMANEHRDWARRPPAARGLSTQRNTSTAKPDTTTPE